MYRVFVLALTTSALGAAPALADPMPLHPDYYSTGSVRRAPPPQAAYRERVPAPEHVQPMPRHMAPQQQPMPARAANRHAPPQHQQPLRQESDLGGGFIEFLFGGGRPVAPPRPRADLEAQRYAALHMPQEPARPEPDPKFLKQIVAYDGPHKPGTIVIDTPQRFLYLVQDNGTAVRYGIGVGKPGFTWAGSKLVTAKREWPDWTPPKEMLERRPDLPTWMAGGPDNPLGARALYLGSSLYRIHGSNEPWTIGQAVSSGCIRMRNEDVVDLYERVKVGTRVIVI